MPQTTYVTREYELKPRQKELLLAAVSRRAPTALRLNHGTLTAVEEDSGGRIGLPLTSHQVKRIERNTRKKMGVELRLSKAQLHAMRKGGVGKLVGVRDGAAHHHSTGGGVKEVVGHVAKATGKAAKAVGHVAKAVATSEQGKRVINRVTDEALKALIDKAKGGGSGLKKKK